jgi:hypothetical protein
VAVGCFGKRLSMADDAERFANAIAEWSDAVQDEIATREQCDETVKVYNHNVAYGLKLSYSIMIEAMRRQLNVDQTSPVVD